MDTFYIFFVIFCFVAVVLAMEGGYLAWNSTRSAEAQRLKRRLRAMVAGEHGVVAALVKQRAPGSLSSLEQLFLRLPHVARLERMLLQAGSAQPVTHFIMVTLLAGVGAFLVTLILHWPLWVCLAIAAAAGAWPVLRLARARRRRLAAFNEQLPDALDLIGRALRAGHAFSGALGMVGTEASDPVAGEFRTTFDEINFGIPMNEALLNLAKRVPSEDLRYFVIAVLLQRDTGGNLAEMLDNLSSLIRARYKLFGTIRTLSAEGRLSAWILSLLPFVAAGLINIINPTMMAVLWTDPVGLKLVWTALAMMAVGIFWMWRIVKIRV